MSLEYLVYRTMMLSSVQICMIPPIGHRYIHVHVRMIAYLVFACSFVHDFVCVGIPGTVFAAAWGFLELPLLSLNGHKFHPNRLHHFFFSFPLQFMCSEWSLYEIIRLVFVDHNLQ